MTSTVSGEYQPDPRTGILGLILDRLDDDGTFTVGFVLGELDTADRAAGIRRVTEVSLRCPACECYYNAKGVSCYRESDVDWVCTEMSDRS